METTFQEFTGKTPKVKDEPDTKIICNQLHIELGQFTQEKPNVSLRKIKNLKAAGFDEILPEI